MTRAPFSQEEFEEDLTNWVEYAPDQNERPRREEAARRIRICKAENGTSLDLKDLGLTSLPKSIGNLTSLERLDLCENQLETLPLTMLDYGRLRLVSLSNNKNPVISQISSVKQLREYLEFKKILETWTKDSVEDEDEEKDDIQLRKEAARRIYHCKYHKDTSLDLSNLKLSSLPDVFMKIPSLTKLNLSQNRLETLPLSMIDLPELTFVDLAKNESKEISQIKNYEQFRTYLLAKLEKGEVATEALAQITDSGYGNKIELPSELVATVLGFIYRGDSLEESEQEGRGQKRWYDQISDMRLSKALKDSISIMLRIQDGDVLQVKSGDLNSPEIQQQLKANFEQLSQEQKVMMSEPHLREKIGQIISNQPLADQLSKAAQEFREQEKEINDIRIAKVLESAIPDMFDGINIEQLRYGNLYSSENQQRLKENFERLTPDQKRVMSDPNFTDRLAGAMEKFYEQRSQAASTASAAPDLSFDEQETKAWEETKGETRKEASENKHPQTFTAPSAAAAPPLPSHLKNSSTTNSVSSPKPEKLDKASSKKPDSNRL